MKIKYIGILLVFLTLFIGVIGLVNATNVEVISDFDNNTLTTVELSESQSKTIWGFENLAKVQTRTGGDMQNTHIETDEGLYNYEYMMLNDTIMEKNDRIYGKNGNQTLIAHYSFSPYAFAQIDILDFHGDSSSSSTYPAMKHTGDSITKTFKEYTDVESGYTPLYILDLDTNVKYQPGDKFTITYNDVIGTGLNKIIKTFQYVYAKDIVVENIIVENRTVYNDTIVDRVIYNDTIIDREVYNDTIINRTFYNDTIIDRIIYNDTVVDRIIYNDTIINREVYNDTIINRTIYNDTIVDRILYNDTIVERIIFNDTVIDRVIFNDTVIDRILYNDTIVNRTIENITYVDKIIEVPVYVDKVIENITYVNKTIEVPIYVDKVIENITYVNKTIENITYVNKTVEVPFYKIIVIPEIIINEPIISISNNNNTDQYNETNPINYQNNNTTNLNNITSNINKENNIGTSTSDNLKTVTMKRTGTDNPIGLIIVIILFGILILIYRRED